MEEAFQFLVFAMANLAINLKNPTGVGKELGCQAIDYQALSIIVIITNCFGMGSQDHSFIAKRVLDQFVGIIIVKQQCLVITYFSFETVATETGYWATNQGTPFSAIITIIYQKLAMFK